MSWLTVALLVFQYGPEFFLDLIALFKAIENRNPEQGKAAVMDGAKIADGVILSLASRTGLNDEQKREQAWRDIVAGHAALGITLSESDARTMAELKHKRLQQDGTIR